MARYGMDTIKQAADLIQALSNANAVSTIQTNDFMEMVRLAKVLHRISEHDCNGTITKRMETQRTNTMIKLETLALCYKLSVHFDGDPRGYVVKLHAPKGDVYNTWGGRESGYGIG